MLLSPYSSEIVGSDPRADADQGNAPGEAVMSACDHTYCFSLIFAKIIKSDKSGGFLENQA